VPHQSGLRFLPLGTVMNIFIIFEMMRYSLLRKKRFRIYTCFNSIFVTVKETRRSRSSSVKFACVLCKHLIISYKKDSFGLPLLFLTSLPSSICILQVETNLVY
jgi:hypothetical protein